MAMVRARTRPSGGWPAMLAGTLLVPAAVVLGFASPAAALASDDYVSTTGSDAASCAQAAPCATVAAAVRQVAPGGTVHVAAGWYAGLVSVPAGLDVTIQGAGEQATVLNGQLAGSTVTVASSATVRLNDLAVVDGRNVDGGGILNSGTLTLNRVQVAFNAATVMGGGIKNEGSLTLVGSTVVGNEAVNAGAGIASLRQLTITGSLVRNNNVTDPAGEGRGAGIFLAYAAAKISDSTVAGNSILGGHGAGIYVMEGYLTASHLTVTGNRAAGAAGLMLSVGGGGQVQGSILANNTGDNCGVGDGDLTVNDNFDSDGTCRQVFGQQPPVSVPAPVGLVIGGDPLLSSVADNGGPSQTQALAAASRAHNAIPAGNALCDGADQRGLPYRYGNSTGCDMGAYQIPTAASASFSQAALDFGTKTTGTVTTHGTWLTNTGGAPLNIASLTAGGDGSYRIVGGSCPQGTSQLLPTASCTILVTFAAGIGSHTGSIDLLDNVGTQRVALTGTGTSVPVEVAEPLISDSVPPLPNGAYADAGTLSADLGNWVGLAPMTYTITWDRCDMVDGGVDVASVGTGPVYQLSSADLGYRLQATITASNSAGTGEPAYTPETPVVMAAFGSPSS